MGQEIYVFDSALTTRISLISDGSLDKLSIEPKNSLSLVEGIYLGKVSKVMPGIDAAFVDCGFQKDAFLNLEWTAGVKKSLGQILDKDRVTEGSKILVQVKSDEREGKGPRVSCEITLVGRYIVFSPDSGVIGISRHIKDKDERSRLSLIASDSKKGKEGVVLRTAAERQGSEKIVDEIGRLRKNWADISKLKVATEAIGLIWPAPTVTERFFRDHMGLGIKSILVSDMNKLEEVKGYCTIYCPEVAEFVEAPTDERARMVEDNLEEQLEEVGASAIRLPSGGRLYFDETRSMTTIDVDTGGHSSKGNRSSIAFQTNLEAASILGRQIRLRNIGGLIVIDFIGMRYGKDKKRVLDTLKMSLKEDILPVKLSGFSEFGIVELTRYRRGFSHSNLMRETCPTCGGNGKVQSICAVVDEIFSALKREILFSREAKFSVISSDRIIKFIREQCSEIIKGIEKSRAVSITLKVDHGVGGVEFRIVSG